MSTDLLHPDPEKPSRLLHDVTEIFAKLPYVARILAFGSLARGDNDCWSDLDMIVITQNSQQWREVFEHLRGSKTILHHNPFGLNPNGVNGHALGNIFAGESVFHCLDLNFFTLADLESPEVFQRFGDTRTLYESPQPLISTNGEAAQADEQNADNSRIYGGGIHFGKKAIKKLLRKRGAIEDVRQWQGILKTIMQDYPADFSVPSGAVGQLAHTYLAIADQLLQENL